MQRYLMPALAGVAVAALLGSGMARCSQRRVDDARAEVRAAQVVADSAEAASARRTKEAQALVDAATAQIAAARTDAAQARRAARAARAAQQELAAVVVPDTCIEVMVRAEAAVQAGQAETRLWRASAMSASLAYDTLRVAYDSLAITHDGTLHALAMLRETSAELERAAKTGLFRRIMPRVGYGVAAGLSNYGRPAVVGGVTFSWGR